jgi:hypothetical protein
MYLYSGNGISGPNRRVNVFILNHIFKKGEAALRPIDLENRAAPSRLLD